MKRTALFSTSVSGNVKSILAIMMALLLLVLTACTSGDNKKTPSENPSSSSQSQTGDNSDSPSGDASTDDTSSDANSSGMTIGTIGVENQTSINTIPSDAEEIEMIVDPTNLMTNYKGYAEKERNKLLNEILSTPNTLELYDVKGKIYYVSTSGNDANDGTSPEKAIQTLAAVDGLPLQDGDAVLFERDCVWRMYEKFDCRSNVTYGSYGKGRKPMFLGSPKNFAQEIWKPSKKKNVWQINYMYAYPCGAFFDQGKEAGYLKTSFRAMTANTHFFFDESMATLYLYCDKGNPSDVWDDIEFSQAGIKIFLGGGVSNVVVDNIALRYTGQGGVGGTYANANVTVTNCEMGFTGGAWVGGDPSSGTRYCNAIEMWCSKEGHNFSHNWIYHTFDSAISPQGNQGFDYHNIKIDNNLLEFNNCDIELFEALPGTYKNFTSNNNICRFTSLGWGTRVEDGGIRGIDGVHRGTIYADQIESMEFCNNIIDCPGRAIYNYRVGSKKAYDNWKRTGNVYYFKKSLRTTTQLTFKFYWPDKDTQHGGFSANTKKEALEAFAQFEPDAKVYWYN